VWFWGCYLIEHCVWELTLKTPAKIDIKYSFYINIFSFSLSNPIQKSRLFYPNIISLFPSPIRTRCNRSIRLCSCRIPKLSGQYPHSSNCWCPLISKFSLFIIWISYHYGLGQVLWIYRLNILHSAGMNFQGNLPKISCSLSYRFYQYRCGLLYSWGQRSMGFHVTFEVRSVAPRLSSNHLHLYRSVRRVCLSDGCPFQEAELLCMWRRGL